MKLSRSSVGLAVRAAREAAGLTLKDLAGTTGITLSTLSRTETGERDLGFAEASAIACAVQIDVKTLHALAETFERDGAAQRRSDLEQHLNALQRAAVEAAIEARSL